MSASVSGARDEVLARVRAATSDVTTAPRPGGNNRPIGHEVLDERDKVLDLFAENVADYRAEVVRVDAADVAAAVADVLMRRGLGSVVVPAGLDASWSAALADVADVVAESEAGSAAELDRIDAVVTASAVGIATTGTIVLDHGPDQGRRELTLVPDTHVCVIRDDQVVHDVPEAVARLGGEAHRGRPLTWVSGPSATSDIELQRVEGVHGPRTLVVVIAAGAAS
ncbi:LUD domain-containing protein [Knoellia locipacati]|uniref:LutC/YkgG family protein n=1 Tax=Knoellia locipacati TaxID=882824 RepID=UPI00384C37EF